MRHFVDTSEGDPLISLVSHWESDKQSLVLIHLSYEESEDVILTYYPLDFIFPVTIGSLVSIIRSLAHTVRESWSSLKSFWPETFSLILLTSLCPPFPSKLSFLFPLISPLCQRPHDQSCQRRYTQSSPWRNTDLYVYQRKWEDTVKRKCVKSICLGYHETNLAYGPIYIHESHTLSLNKNF